MSVEEAWNLWKNSTLVSCKITVYLGKKRLCFPLLIPYWFYDEEEKTISFLITQSVKGVWIRSTGICMKPHSLSQATGQWPLFWSGLSKVSEPPGFSENVCICMHMYLSGDFPQNFQESTTNSKELRNGTWL